MVMWAKRSRSEYFSGTGLEIGMWPKWSQSTSFPGIFLLGESLASGLAGLKGCEQEAGRQSCSALQCGKRPPAVGERSQGSQEAEGGREGSVSPFESLLPIPYFLCCDHRIISSLFLFRIVWAEFPPFITKGWNTEGGEMLLYSRDGFMGLSFSWDGSWLIIKRSKIAEHWNIFGRPG